MERSVLVKTDRLQLCELQDSDEKYIYQIASETVTLKDEKYQKVFNSTYWEEVNSETTLNAMIFLLDSGAFVGRVCMKHIDKALSELGVEILGVYQNNGYGPEAIKAFCEWYAQKYNVNEISVRIENENAHSIHIFEKLGAKYVGQSCWLSEEAIGIIQNYFSEDVSKAWENNIREYLLCIPVKN